MKAISIYFLYFIIYSFFGWSIEVICKLFEKHKFINRGFLIGPLCPIYGVGTLLIVLVIGTFTKDILSVFLKTIFVCSILEYLTSYIMEKIFNVRWWDYSSKRFNLNGRICLRTMLAFGALGVLVIYGIHPFVSGLLLSFNDNLIFILAGIVALIFILDFIFSCIIMFTIKNQIIDTAKDNTEAIKRYIDKWLDSNSIFYRRIKEAYPNFIIMIKGYTDIAKDLAIDTTLEVAKSFDELKNIYDNTQKELKESYEKNKERIKNSLKK